MTLVSNEDSPPVDSYRALPGEIKERIRSAQYAALRAVNLELLTLYWDIGRLICQRQQGETWGPGVVENLAKDLQTEFPGVGGFSAASLWRVKQFYEAYAGENSHHWCEKLAGLPNVSTLRCRADSHDKSVARMPDKEIDPNRKSRADYYHRHIE
jgi:hypothetical protein